MEFILIRIFTLLFYTVLDLGGGGQSTPTDFSEILLRLPTIMFKGTRGTLYHSAFLLKCVIYYHHFSYGLFHNHDGSLN